MQLSSEYNKQHFDLGSRWVAQNPHVLVVKKDDLSAEWASVVHAVAVDQKAVAVVIEAHDVYTYADYKADHKTLKVRKRDFVDEQISQYQLGGVFLSDDFLQEHVKRYGDGDLSDVEDLRLTPFYDQHAEQPLVFAGKCAVAHMQIAENGRPVFREP